MKPIAWAGLLLILAGIVSIFYNPLATVATDNAPLVSGDLPAVLILCGISLLVVLSHDRHRFR